MPFESLKVNGTSLRRTCWWLKVLPEEHGKHDMEGALVLPYFELVC